MDGCWVNKQKTEIFDFRMRQKVRKDNVTILKLKVAKQLIYFNM